jgi:hypothetical protein
MALKKAGCHSKGIKRPPIKTTNVNNPPVNGGHKLYQMAA